MHLCVQSAVADEQSTALPGDEFQRIPLKDLGKEAPLVYARPEMRRSPLRALLRRRREPHESAEVPALQLDCVFVQPDPSQLPRWWRGGREPPRIAVWEITLACGHCGSRAGRRRPEELSTAEALDVVAQLAAIGIREVTLIGGEAYLREDWADIAHAVTEAGMVCTMVTGANGFDAWRVGDQSDFVAMALSEPELLYSKVHLSHGRLIGLGRAAEHPGEHLLSPRSDFPYGRCGEVINRPVVYPNGDLQACCCAGGKIAAFTVGNLARGKLSVLVARMRHRSHFRFIGAFGPRHLYEAMRGQDNQRHASICDLCVAASSGFGASEVDDITERWVLGQLLHA